LGCPIADYEGTKLEGDDLGIPDMKNLQISSAKSNPKSKAKSKSKSSTSAFPMFGKRLQGARELEDSSDSDDEDSDIESVWSLSSDEEVGGFEGLEGTEGLKEGDVFLLGARVCAVGKSACLRFCSAYRGPALRAMGPLGGLAKCA
jgi:hypothetical protein